MDTNTTSRQRALVVGLGISGTASALRLHRAGWDVVVLEKAPERRRGGYFIALFGTGIAAAERLGIAGAVPDRADPSGASYDIDRTGRRRRGLGYANLPGKNRLVVRGDIEDAAFSALPDEAEIRYATVPTALAQDFDGVDVEIRDLNTETTTIERFDLVVGADGLRSTVRRLAFEPEQNRTHRLGYMIAAFSLPEPVPGYRKQDGLILAEPGRSVWVFSFSDRPPTVLFSYRTDDVDAEFTRPAIDSLRAAYGPEPTGSTLGWLLDQFEKAPDHLFDSAEQVHLEHWHRGRVVLVGDAAWCLTLYSGMGASTGLAGADLLGTMLERHPDDVPAALRDWEEHLRPFIDYHLRSGVSMRSFFTPANQKELLLRSVVNHLSRLPIAQKLLAKTKTDSADARMKSLDIAAAAA
ncbi:2-polyprenyl-6-methoxyphenol hydroxylase-like FAD-dependent oxidoreductase [Pseudonocardia hierapolitana]|uniref:2-polyprenyl-6-methoxyphenol hydroxylase-like FAD-dependent oxidoreductase n=1 Tax=Pseudonocardia hierapolitana TaxID=1128676 RepID=A0A561T594_9PSEU|nr:FAD-dependent monooxygenase [Pseudonocardia hierapolitana]TWF82269.1 2-polyprenyl-6-methoxyphenol hydroxylase-like FAD-dependent oxidoreductase [Pseudonocardia hierapolitana]